MDEDWESQVRQSIEELRKGDYLPKDHHKVQSVYELIFKGMNNGNKEQAVRYISELDKIMAEKEFEMWR